MKRLLRHRHQHLYKRISRWHNLDAVLHIVQESTKLIFCLNHTTGESTVAGHCADIMPVVTTIYNLQYCMRQNCYMVYYIPKRNAF